MGKKKLLLHSCCGPCSTAVIERLLKEGYDITVFYFNPNITDPAEYEHRKSEQIRLIEELRKKGNDIKFMDGFYEPQEFLEAVSGYEDEPEGGKRCELCFAIRLEAAAWVAAEYNFDCFDTTLSLSPHKNYDKIKAAGDTFAYRYGVEFLAGNYKKKDGFKRSIELSKEYGLYRQDYCGCVFSLREAEAYRKARQEEG